LKYSVPCAFVGWYLLIRNEPWQSLYELEVVEPVLTQRQNIRSADTVEATNVSALHTNEVIMQPQIRSSVAIDEQDRIRLPAGIVNWELAPGIKREACTTDPRPGNKFQIPIRELIDKEDGWRWKIDATPGWKGKNWGNMKHFYADACKYSAIRVLWDEYGYVKKGECLEQVYQNHQDGKQLTTSIYGTYVDKGQFFRIVEASNQTSSELRDAIPLTKHFSTKGECKEFCEEESARLDKWLFKRVRSSHGYGVEFIGNEESCLRTCGKVKPSKLQAQALTDTMVTPSGHKFDVRSFMLVANVEPLIVFTGFEFARVCIESIHNKNPTPYPKFPNSTFNYFQQVCNIGITTQHPTFRQEEIDNYVVHLDKVIDDPELRRTVQHRLDAIDLGAAEVLKSMWKGKVGMFHLFCLDYLVDQTGKGRFRRAGIRHYSNDWYSDVKIYLSISQ
jgi:Tubulin-tyrosine ligase family